MGRNMVLISETCQNEGGKIKCKSGETGQTHVLDILKRIQSMDNILHDE